MKALRQSAVAAGFAAALLMAGCAHHDQMAKTTSTNDVGTISSTQAAQAGVIPGPAKIDSAGNVYTSSAAPGSGTPATEGTNTNVNIVPKKAKSSVIVTETPAPAPIVVETPAPAPVVVETPAPAPIVVETPAPVETPTMTSSSKVDEQTTTTTVKTTKRHRRMAKE